MIGIRTSEKLNSPSYLSFCVIPVEFIFSKALKFRGIV